MSHTERICGILRHPADYSEEDQRRAALVAADIVEAYHRDSQCYDDSKPFVSFGRLTALSQVEINLLSATLKILNLTPGYTLQSNVLRQFPKELL